MEELTVVTQAGLDKPDGSSDVSRQVAFDSGDVLRIQSRVARGVRRDVITTVTGMSTDTLSEDTRYSNTGKGGNESMDLDAGDSIRVPPRTIPRVVNPTDED